MNELLWLLQRGRASGWTSITRIPQLIESCEGDKQDELVRSLKDLALDMAQGQSEYSTG